MEVAGQPQLNFVANGLAFLKRQEKDWNVTVARTSLDKLAYQMVFPYLSIFIIALGASATELGMVNSIGMVIAAVTGPLTGWYMDRLGPKRIYLVGIAFMAVSYLTYGLAQSWETAILAMIAYWLGFSTSVHSCSTICGNCLANKDRATGMTICETVAAGLLGMAGPMLATWVITLGGGVNVRGIRPLFFIGLLITFGTYTLVQTQLSDRRWTKKSTGKPHLFQDVYDVVKGGKHLNQWIMIGAITQAPRGMVFPFSQVYAYQIKGANEFILGAMVTGCALSSIVFAIPLGRLADRVGRKKALYLTIPLFWLSNVLLVWAPSPAFLILAGILQGFSYIGGPIGGAIERELVPADQMGRWVGVNRLFKMLMSAFLALTAGIIWDKLGPQYVFIAFLAIDILIRMPLLIRMPETLHAKLEPETSGA